MYAELLNYRDNWQAVKDAALNTIGKEHGKYPDEAWKYKMLLAEHSPIRLLTYTVRLHDLPYLVSVHLTRHKIGVEHFVSTQRTDRTGEDRTALRQDALVTHTLHLNAQALITISRKRLCNMAAPETRQAWKAVVDAVRAQDPIVAQVCVPECVYRGFCPELYGCTAYETALYKLHREAYVCGALVRIC